ncbi:hypothetical protein F4820DRAFT_372440 [Hypoxylon rubiginosum]|uniref:Uncharacterized protein n=1 Tax=Hypoxylon rubiginosum TaxID=110542 RepID=A0ACB9YVR8_9PEZI|nr:hypothetical protein F4820DRAFT_372440 [Hypoxylon rubiginosum]
MRFSLLLSVGALVPAIGVVAVPLGDVSKRENLCNLKAPPALCQPDPSVTVEETAQRAYNFYRAFVVDGDPRTMFSLIDSSYIQHHPGYASGPQTIWSIFCSGSKLGNEASTAWCFDASTNMSYARYSTIDRWKWVDGCVHEHWDQGETIPTGKCYQLNTTTHTSGCASKRSARLF